MKILVISNLYPPHSIGGYEERCRQIVDRLIERGHEIRVLTSTHGVEKEQIEPHIHRRLKVHGYFGHPWLQIIELYNLEKYNRSILLEEIQSFNPDIIHIFNLNGLNKGLILTLQECELHTVFDVSDHWLADSLKIDVWLRWWNGETGTLKARLARRILNISGLANFIRAKAPFAKWEKIKFKRIYFGSKALKQLTIRNGFKVEHAEVIYTGIDCKKFKQRIENKEFSRLLFVGRLHEDKDTVTAIRALKLLPAHFSLTIYGHGEKEYIDFLKNEAQDMQDRVSFKFATAKEMVNVYSEYDVLVFTSAWEEPFSRTPLEAMASKLPVISTLEGGTKELIRHGENALSFKTSDPSDLAKQILQMENQPAERARIVETAYNDVTTDFDIQRGVEKIESYLQESCSE
ncbi:MAG: glycosyltransferase family 4 protein [Armatimonadetes bacterium]|nr:glycosyltransferase family 4 protein [Armatimonadota bacterium]